MKRVLIFAAILVMAGSLFAGSICTQKVVTAQGFLKGSTTISLSGQMTESAMDGIARGESIAVYNSLDSYLVFPTLLQKTKTGYGKKFNTKNVSVSAKNGKFQWTEKDVTKYLCFAVGRERIKPDKATLKSNGTVDTADLAKLDDKRLTVYDYSCAEKGLGHLASLSCPLEKKGKNYKYSKKDQDLQVKLSANSNGKVSASYKLQPNVASPAFIDNEYVFTNKYDYFLEFWGEGGVYSGFYGPDQVEFRVTENNSKFRFFNCGHGVLVTNEYMTLELKEDTKIQVNFGKYEFALNVVGGGSAVYEFSGTDYVSVGALKGGPPFRHFSVNGRIYTGRNLFLQLTEDTVVEAVFGTYDFTTRIIGGGSIDYEFTEPDLVEIKALDGGNYFRYFLVNGQKRTEKSLQLSLQENTVVEAVFGNYDLSFEIEGNGSVDYEFTGPDNVEVRVLDGDAPFRNFMVNGEYCADETLSLALREDTVVKAVFGTYAFRTEVLGNGSEEHEFLGPDLVEVRVPQNSAFWRYFKVNGEIRKNTTTLLVYLHEDTVVEAVFGTYYFSLGFVGRGSVTYEFTGPDEVEIKVSEGGALFRYFNVNGKNYTDNSIQISLEKDTSVSAVFGAYAFSTDVVGDGSIDFEFLDHDLVEVRVPEDSSLFRYFTVNGQNNYTGKTIRFYLFKDTVASAVFGKYECEIVVVGSGRVKSEFTGADEIYLSAISEEDIFSCFEWNGCVTNLSPISIQLACDTVVTATFTAANYLVVDIRGGTSAEKWPYIITTRKPNVASDECRGEELWLRYVPPGSYTMGSPKNENGRGTREDQHKVTISKGFYIGVFEVTQKQYKLITDTSYPNNKDTYPCCKVNFEMLRGKDVGAGWPEHDRVNSSSVIGVIRAKTGLRFDIPTEAQWEYACRAGTTTAYNSGNNMYDKNFDLKEICNYLSSETLKVGSLKPNKWGLYDMHGNVWEWCLDWYTDNLGFDPVVDPTGPETGETKVLRGGYYRSEWYECRSAYRSYSEPDHDSSQSVFQRFGFRFVVNEK
ncbi:SUMF1/EgtB/PvdO family nonheme iron enzyme [bacterium]|nr:SUMF1/EgtB/PvdO family nonheme iron enzyme [bacterium]